MKIPYYPSFDSGKPDKSENDRASSITETASRIRNSETAEVCRRFNTSDAFRTAAAIARGNARTNPEKFALTGRSGLELIEIAESEERRLRIWAEELCIPREFSAPRGSVEYNDGNEHQLWLTVLPDGERRIFKATKNDRFGFTIIKEPKADGGFAINGGPNAMLLSPPSWYLERLAHFNREFPESAFRLEAITDGPRGILSIVTSQPFFFGDRPSKAQIHTYLQQRDFLPASWGLFYREADRLIVGDTKPENFVLHKAGNRSEVRPVDLLMRTADDALRDILISQVK